MPCQVVPMIKYSLNNSNIIYMQKRRSDIANQMARLARRIKNLDEHHATLTSTHPEQHAKRITTNRIKYELAKKDLVRVEERLAKIDANILMEAQKMDTDEVQ
jgi:hypothetical protein